MERINRPEPIVLVHFGPYAQFLHFGDHRGEPMYFGDHRKDLGLLAASFVHLVPIQRLFVRVVPIQHLFPCDHNPQSRGITGLLDMKRLLFAQMGLRSNGS